jgi:hypothetical protein
MKPYLFLSLAIFLDVLLVTPARALPGKALGCSHDARPADTTATKQLRVQPSPGPGHRVQLTLRDLPAVPVLVTIQDRLGFTHYQQWHQPDQLLTVRFEDTARTLPPGVYSATVSTRQLFLKEKFIVE